MGHVLAVESETGDQRFTLSIGLNPVSEMTYNVLSRMLNIMHSLTHSIAKLILLAVKLHVSYIYYRIRSFPRIIKLTVCGMNCSFAGFNG